MRQFIFFKTKVLALVLTIAALAVGHGSVWAASTFTVTSSTSGTTTTFTINRSGDTSVAETVRYRTVSLSAMEGQNFNAVSGTLNFAADETSKTVSVTERTATGMFQYAAGSGGSGYRQYRFEVLDANGFLLAYRTRSLEVTRVLTEATSGTYDLGNERNGTFYFDGPLTITDDGYNKNPKDWPDKKYFDLPSTAFYDASTQTYLVENRTELRMTLDFYAYEAQDGYQYVQVLTDNTSTCDSGAGDGDPGTIQLSRYMAGFEIKTGSAYTGDYKKFTFPVLTVGNNEGHTNPWGHGTDFPLSKQKFNPTQQWFSSSTRASDGKIILNTNFNTIVLRFDASGSGEDNWVVNNIIGRVTAVDEIAPVANNNQIIVSPGPYNKGNDFYISVPFSEIVLGRPTLSTTWGDATYFGGDGTNVLTFKGTITANAGTTLSVTGYSGSAPWDLFHNDLTGTISKTLTGIVSTDFVREPIGSITYSTTLGAYEINSVANLSDLAVYVNGKGTYSTGGDEETTAHNCEGMTFKMTADIDFQPASAWDDYASLEHNCNAIGYVNKSDRSDCSYFGGTFDGQDHTISGIRNNSYAYCSGLFGCNSGTVQNVKIANARITGWSNSGGIVGENYKGTVSNCHAAHNVAIRTAIRTASGVGGIVGDNFEGCTVKDCTSAAVITCANAADCTSFGGIVGYNTEGCTVSGCTATGVVVPDVTNAGAVIGNNKGTVSGNKYHSSMVGNYAFNIGSGTGDIDGIALNNKTLMLYTERDNSALLAAYAATYTGNSSTAHNASHPTVSSLNVTLKGYTLHKDGSWNTIALPFDFKAYSGSPLSGATIKQLDTDNTAYDSESGVLQVAFKTVTVNTTTGMERTKPYIVRWNSGADVSDPTFTNVDGRYLSNAIGSTTDTPIIIRGSSKPFTLAEGMLLDAHNADNLGCHAAIVLSAPETSAGYTFDGWFTDEQRTADPAVIPFGTDGSFNLYAKLTKNELTLADGSSNAEAIEAAAASGKVYEVTLQGRTLYKDGDWNTLCLPFAMTAEQIAASQLAGCTLMELDGGSSVLDAEGTLTLSFTEATSITAGTPYIIKWNKAADYDEDPTKYNIVSPVFEGVTVTATTNDVSFTGGEFKGTYTSQAFTEENKSILFLGAEDKLYYPLDGASIGAFRAYFQLSDPNAQVKAFVMNFGEDDATSISEELRVKSEESATALWFTLDGRRLAGKPARSGIYINNGRKVIIK
ncbi:MAG: hypothetical protein IJ615_04205 [Bacteroidaceae bacterium]|nr:hypothetical protein [Bacteroidaceae bacterium]